MRTLTRARPARWRLVAVTAATTLGAVGLATPGAWADPLAAYPAVASGPDRTAPVAAAAEGATLVVATTGDDGNPGTPARPLGTLQRAVDLAQPGTTISVRGGTYRLARNVQILKSGQAGKPITLTAYQNEVVTVDGESLPASHTPVGGSVPRPERGAIHMEASYWKIVGLRITRGPYGLYCSGCNNNVFERLVTYDNYESGLQLQGASANNQIINLDSYLNHDPRKNGESADGLAIKEGAGTGNVVRGARLWNNVDDGFDAWKFTSPITIEASVAWGNGVNRWNFPNFAGDGNGFKMGGGGPAANHTVRNSIAFDNAVGGFIDNGNEGSLTIANNTAWRNGGTGFDFADSTSTLTGNLSVANRTAVKAGSSRASGNSWNLPGPWTLASTDPAKITGARGAGGAIVTSPFLRPANGAAVGARI
ncbi:MAG TPA: right-handed parallel beta-helix repeat-containing protein [Catenuloplanes sp.]|jgi:hypothetical protein